MLVAGVAAATAACESREIGEDERRKIVKDAIMHILIISQDVFSRTTLCRSTSRVSISRTSRANTIERKRQTNEMPIETKYIYIFINLGWLGQRKAAAVCLPFKRICL